MEKQLEDEQEEYQRKIDELEQQAAYDRRVLSEEQKKIEAQIELEEQKLKKQSLEQQISEQELEIFNKQEESKHKASSARLHEEVKQREEVDLGSRERRSRVLGWLKIAFTVLLFVATLILLSIGLYRFYRWATEEPLIKEVEKMVEVEKVVEKKVEVEKLVEKEVIPDECTQIRRNGKVYVSCDGVKIDGKPTIGDSGLKEIPELVTE